MRNKAILILVLLATVCLACVCMIISNTDAEASNVFAAYSEYKQAKQLDDQKYVDKVQEYTAKIAELNTQKADLASQSQKLNEELTAIINEQAKEAETITEANAQFIYNNLVTVSKTCNVEIDKYYTFEDGTYSVSLRGCLGDINLAIQKFDDSFQGPCITYGNVSLRQNYDAYNLERSYDSGTLLEWYDNKIINALGETISLEDLLVEEETDAGIVYTVASLDDVQYDTEGLNAELLVSNSLYEDKINKLNDRYGEQLTILERAGYSDEVREELKTKISDKYNDDLATLAREKEEAAGNIRIKYDKKYEEDKNKVANAISTYKAKVEELKSMLADSSMLEYTLDFTIMGNS